MEINEELVPDNDDGDQGGVVTTAVTNTSNLHVSEQPDRSRSPVTVQEWVASLPSHDDNGDDHHDQDCQEDKEEEEEVDNIVLGEEASFYSSNETLTSTSTNSHGAKNFGQLLLQKNNKNLR